MSIEAKEKNGATCVTWKTLQSLAFSSREISKTFELNTQGRSNFSFKVSFTHCFKFNCLSLNNVYIKLCLSLIKCSTNTVSLCGGKDTIFNCDHNLPCSVWVTINNDEDRRINLEKAVGSDEWTSRKFGIRTFGYPTFHFLLQFRTDEINKSSKIIMKQLTDAQQTPLAEDKDNVKVPKSKEFCRGKLIAQQLEKVFVEQTNCDVEFLFEDEEKIGGHISILAARSPVFSAMFYHNLQESETGKIFVQDIRPQIFKEMLHYIYSGQTLAPLTDAIAQPLFVLSVKYDIEDLKEKCVRYLLRSVRTSNAVDLLVWANLHSVEKIEEAALDFVARNFKIICQSNEWENLMKNYPELGFLVARRYVAV